MITGIKRRKTDLFVLPECNGLIRKLPSGEYCLYAKIKNGKNIVRKKIGTYYSLETAQKIQQEI